MGTLLLISERGMSLGLAVEMARTMAARRNCGIYVLRQSDGYRPSTSCDGRVNDVCAVVGTTGVTYYAT
jgi:hypothetical protein